MVANSCRRLKGSFKVAGVSAGVRAPSRTRTLALAIGAAVGDRVETETSVVDVSTLWKQIAVVANPKDADQEAQATFRAIEDADLVVTASPTAIAS
ncbi:NAD(P)H-dependent oxidoreductase [Hyphomicrobium zavarzinii]|uniref:NAD(P)H-dependent oxidoreductase n=1 Tax=Hyphomicrobium zavarzinii TaxID=48292 RepID=UPI0009FC12F5|nr:NAD(P)H-dependent oxidoreductase [Hyphomicrobium zavarzinii]